MVQTVKMETCSQWVCEVTLSCWFWLDSDYMASFHKLGGKTNQKISIGTMWRRCSEKRYKNGLIYLLAVRIKDIYESSRQWRVGSRPRPLESWHLCQKVYFTFHLSVLENEMVFGQPQGHPWVKCAVTGSGSVQKRSWVCRSFRPPILCQYAPFGGSQGPRIGLRGSHRSCRPTTDVF